MSAGSRRVRSKYDSVQCVLQKVAFKVWHCLFTSSTLLTRDASAFVDYICDEFWDRHVPKFIAILMSQRLPISTELATCSYDAFVSRPCPQLCARAGPSRHFSKTLGNSADADPWLQDPYMSIAALAAPCYAPHPSITVNECCPAP